MPDGAPEPSTARSVEPPSLDAIAAFLDQLLGAPSFPDDPPTVYRASDRPVRRMMLALDAARLPDLLPDGIDALFLHRPWGVENAAASANVGVLASHAEFDHRLTVGMNPDLARQLGMKGVVPLGEKDGRAIGMIGDVRATDAAAVLTRIRRLFGGWEDEIPGRADEIRRIAAVGAMTDTLVREAAERGADLYVTGQLRQPARAAVGETGVHALAVGHARSEEYGLRLLRRHLRRRFGGLHITCVTNTGPRQHGLFPLPRPEPS